MSVAVGTLEADGIRVGGRRASAVMVGDEPSWLAPAVSAAAEAATDSLYSTTSAAFYDAVSNRTWFAYNGVNRDCYVTYWDHATSTLATPAFVGATVVSAFDNHGSPSLVLDSAGHLCVVYGNHDGLYKFARSANARDLAGVWTITDTPYVGTYMNLRSDAVSGDLLIFYRSGGEASHTGAFPAHEYTAYVRSSNFGATWTAQAPIIDTTGFAESHADPYIYDIQQGPDDLFYFCWTVARGTAHDGTRLNVHCARWNPATVTWTTVGGTSLGATIDATDHASCLVANAGNAGSGAEAGVVRLAFHPTTARPWLIFTDGAAAGGIQPYVSEWTGSAWSTVALPILQSYTFAFCALRFRGDGSLDAYVPGIRPAGWSVSVVERFNNKSGAWVSKGYVGLGEAGYAGIERVQVPRNSRDDFAVLFENNNITRTQEVPTSGTATVSPLYVATSALVVDLGTSPAFVFEDAFTRANTSGTPGYAWALANTSGSNQIQVSSGKLAMTATVVGTHYTHQGPTCGTADQYAQIDVTAAPGGTTAHPHVAVRFNFVATGNFDGYSARWNPATSQWQILRIVAATATVVASSAVDSAPTLPYTLRIEAVGSVITVKANGATKVSYTDGTPLTTGRRGAVGFRWATSADQTARADNYAHGELA